MSEIDPDPDLLHRVEKALGTMTVAQREIFLAHRLDDMSYAEIGRRTGLTVSQVERHMIRAICKLDRQMNGERIWRWERWF